MDPRKTGGATTAKKLDMVSDPTPWAETASVFLEDSKPLSCPICGQDGLRAIAACGSDRVGFLLLSCPSCEKSAHFSRVVFPSTLEIPAM